VTRLAPPFAWIDEVLACEHDHLVAVRTFRADEYFFRGHFPGRPMVPGVFLLEAMAQCFAHLALSRGVASGSGALSLTGIERARFRRPVLPGERVDLEVRVDGEEGGVLTVSTHARVGEARVAEARLSGRLVP
jgi:3-hydroxyacyl-[acyl-carrier-protein] dehydratase